METAGNKEFEEDTEKKGLGTPATRAGIIEKLIASQYAVRKGKQILPTEDGKVLIDILPDFLKSATMTAEWENQLLEMEQGKMASGQFMTGSTYITMGMPSLIIGSNNSLLRIFDYLFHPFYIT